MHSPSKHHTKVYVLIMVYFLRPSPKYYDHLRKVASESALIDSKTLTHFQSKTEASPKTGGLRFGSFFMRSRSRSLESIDLVQSKLDLPTNKKRNSRETDDEDDSYSRQKANVVILTIISMITWR